MKHILSKVHNFLLMYWNIFCIVNAWKVNPTFELDEEVEKIKEKYKDE